VTPTSALTVDATAQVECVLLECAAMMCVSMYGMRGGYVPVVAAAVAPAALAAAASMQSRQKPTAPTGTAAAATSAAAADTLVALPSIASIDAKLEAAGKSNKGASSSAAATASSSSSSSSSFSSSGAVPLARDSTAADDDADSEFVAFYARALQLRCAREQSRSVPLEHRLVAALHVKRRPRLAHVLADAERSAALTRDFRQAQRRAVDREFAARVRARAVVAATTTTNADADFDSARLDLCDAIAFTVAPARLVGGGGVSPLLAASSSSGFALPATVQRVVDDFERFYRQRHGDARKLQWALDQGSALVTMRVASTSGGGGGGRVFVYDALVSTLQMLVLHAMGDGGAHSSASLLARLGCDATALQHALLSLTAERHPLLVQAVGAAPGTLVLSEWHPSASASGGDQDDDEDENEVTPLVIVHRVQLAAEDANRQTQQHAQLEDQMIWRRSHLKHGAGSGGGSAVDVKGSVTGDASGGGASLMSHYSYLANSIVQGQLTSAAATESDSSASGSAPSPLDVADAAFGAFGAPPLALVRHYSDEVHGGLDSVVPSSLSTGDGTATLLPQLSALCALGRGLGLADFDAPMLLGAAPLPLAGADSDSGKHPCWSRQQVDRIVPQARMSQMAGQW
jgi:hypothetical protein